MRTEAPPLPFLIPPVPPAPPCPACPGMPWGLPRGMPWDRTRISYHAAPKTTSRAVPASRDRKDFAEPIALNRKSGEVESLP